jgi:hypothetical protein
MTTEFQAMFRKFGPVAILLALLAGALCVYAYFGDRHHFLQSYLFAWTFWVGLTLGCFGFTLLHHTIRGTWGLPILRILESGGGPVMILVMGIFALPIVFGVHDLYHHWSGPEAATDIVLQRKSFYLNEPFFIARTVFYFLSWAGIAWYLRSSSLREDRTGDANEAVKRTNFSAPMLIWFVITITLAATDWTMSLDPHWFSAIYGIIYMVGGALSAIALINIMVMRSVDKEPYRQVMNPGLSKDLGNLMFVFTLLWAYTSLSQFLIIYMGNLPEFNVFYEIRSKPGWNELSLFLVFGQFLAPFVILLAPRSKSDPRVLAGIAIWVFLVRFVEQFWNTIPFMRPDFGVAWTDAAAIVFLGAVWFAVFSRQLQVGSMLPAHSPRLKEAYEHAS